jgi:hypothetical protein
MGRNANRAIHNQPKLDKRRQARAKTAPIHARSSLGGRTSAKVNIRKISAGTLLPMLRLEGVEDQFLRQPSSFVPKSYRLEKQLKRLIDHLFVRYPVPEFLYAPLLPPCKYSPDTRPLFRQWFAVIGRGDSFRKLVQEHMTAREAALFLSGRSFFPVEDNIWWARMKAAGLPEHAIFCLLRRIFHRHAFEDPDGRLRSAIGFFARFRQEFDRVTFDEVLDFLDWKLRNEETFRLTGRTAASVIKLSNEWHFAMHAAKVNTSVRWKGLRIKDWNLEGENFLWRVKQLRTNRELMDEGRKQCHCVYSYVEACVEGDSAIFSLRTYPRVMNEEAAWDWGAEERRVTIELSRERKIVQVRGRLNRAPDDVEREVVRRWACDACCCTQAISD